MDKIYKVDLVQITDEEPLTEKLEKLLNERVVEGYILDKVFSFVNSGYEALLVVTIKPPEPELELIMTPDGQIPIIV